MDVPGYEIATQVLQYDLHSHSGDRRQANYVKQVEKNGRSEFLYLTITDNGRDLQCAISANYKMVTISTGNLSFPHKNFVTFEHQVMACIP